MNESTTSSMAHHPIGASRFCAANEHRRLARRRPGTAVLEFAVVAPVLFMLAFGIIEFGRMVMVHQLLEGAVREGARLAILDGTTAADVEQVVRAYLTATSVNAQEAEITVTPDPAAATRGTAMMVRTTIAFEKVSWLPAPFFLQGATLKATATMRHE